VANATIKLDTRCIQLHARMRARAASINGRHRFGANASLVSGDREITAAVAAVAPDENPDAGRRSR
jgi:hypothetical protein